jgi:hypothetical protein
MMSSMKGRKNALGDRWKILAVLLLVGSFAFGTLVLSGGISSAAETSTKKQTATKKPSPEEISKQLSEQSSSKDQPPTKGVSTQALNQVELFLASKRLWYEQDWDGDWVCHLYDIRVGTPSQPVSHLRVVRFDFYRNPFTGQCYRSVQTPNYGGVGFVSGNWLVILWPSGYREYTYLRGYYPSLDLLAIWRSNPGNSYLAGCNSPYNPYC